MMKEKYYSVKQKMNMEMNSILELLDKTLFIKLSDDEKIRNLEFIRSCRLRYLELERQFLMEKQSKDKRISNYIHYAKDKHSNI